MASFQLLTITGTPQEEFLFQYTPPKNMASVLYGKLNAVTDSCACTAAKVISLQASVFKFVVLQSLSRLCGKKKISEEVTQQIKQYH